jgi:hypothetical protein
MLLSLSGRTPGRELSPITNIEPNEPVPAVRKIRHVRVNAGRQKRTGELEGARLADFTVTRSVLFKAPARVAHDNSVIRKIFSGEDRACADGLPSPLVRFEL